MLLCCVSSQLTYRYYFQLLATNVLPAHGFYGIIQHFGWKRIGLIVQDEKLYTAVSQHSCKKINSQYCDQTVDILKKMLDENAEVDYTEIRFRSDKGFGSVKAFVSSSLPLGVPSVLALT